ncbi:hypothetical protein BU26DRAFT_257009 [Trematosphaeria pertusa]|uniref:DUF7730 domain-containing protein n=1 Tax=Trematosphaeria pertusa TaxID=390896 RepID=A0A6A6IRJ1_9PLEO|nr:uncharacterized protein BU26DRAFT_257009 [Trematosphaeria pertusa]KAF2252422.1 hypothetical protein BU26DRAFT_257009 [Trematosphaeria pertusa]
MPPRKFTLPFFSPRTKSKPSEHPNTTPSAIHTPQHAKPQPQQAHPQQQSLFFSKLPPELRIEVYQLLIPRSKCISVETRQAMLRHMPLDPECTNEEERKPWTRDPRRIVEEHDTEWHRRPRMTQWDYGWTRGDVQELDVFLACRRIYHEVAELLYSSRTFCIGSPITLVKLQHLYLPPVPQYPHADAEPAGVTHRSS